LSLFQEGDMSQGLQAKHPHLWIAYPWVHREERDFGYVIPHLKVAGVEATFDSIRLDAEMPLWQQIIPRLVGSHIRAFSGIVTAPCLTRRAYADELVTALDQTLQYMGPNFTRIGLLHGIGIQDLPPTLRLLPCVSLSDPAWNLQVAEALKARPRGQGPADHTRFIWKIHPSYGGNPAITAVEVCSKSENIQYWRFAIPKSVAPYHWGQGPSGGGEISPVRVTPVKGSARYARYEVTWFGAANAITETESAYAVFAAGQLPEFVCFGSAKGPHGPPVRMELFWTRTAKQRVEAGS
jgi:hypothetical protein